MDRSRFLDRSYRTDPSKKKDSPSEVPGGLPMVLKDRVRRNCGSASSSINCENPSMGGSAGLEAARFHWEPCGERQLATGHLWDGGRSVRGPR